MKNPFRFGKSSGIRAGQTGVVLLEALIAILIFSLGILTIIGIQAASIRGVGDAQLRTRAVLLADQLVGRMWVNGGTIGELEAAFESPGGALYEEWLEEVIDFEKSGLPGVAADSDTAPEVEFRGAGLVDIRLYWRTPSMPSGERHQYIVTTQISRNQ